MIIKLQDMEIEPHMPIKTDECYQLTIRVDRHGKIDKGFCALNVVKPDSKEWATFSPSIKRFATVRKEDNKPTYDIYNDVLDAEWALELVNRKLREHYRVCQEYTSVNNTPRPEQTAHLMAYAVLEIERITDMLNKEANG